MSLAMPESFVLIETNQTNFVVWSKMSQNFPAIPAMEQPVAHARNQGGVELAMPPRA